MGTTTRKRKKKGLLSSRFYRVYFALVVVALIGIAVGTLWLNGVLRDYESAQPVYAAQIVAQLFESSDYDRIYALDTAAADISDGDKDFYVENMTALAAGKRVEWTQAFSADPDERRYTVTLDGDKFATFTLVPNGQTTARGNRLWKLGSVTTNVAIREPEPTPEPEPEATPQSIEQTQAPAATNTCIITVPRGYTVTVNGVQLDGSNARATEKAIFDDGFLPPSVSSPVVVEYAYDTQSQFFEVEVTDESGAAVEVAHDEARAYTWSCAPKEDAALKAQYSDSVLALARVLARFTAKDTSKSALMNICAKGSPAQQIFENLDNQYYTRHSSSDFRNEAISEFYTLSEDCITCHVSFDFTMQTSAGELVYPTEYTFCIVKQGQKGKLYNLLIY